MECFTLGWHYDKGRGVPQDETRAAALYQKSCDAGFGPSCFNLGRMYEEGRGVKKDSARMLLLFRDACDKKVEPACARLKDAGSKG